MHRTLPTQLLAAALLAACTDPPLATGPVDNAVVAFALSSPCTKSWVDPGGGAWEDAGNWLPTGVPGVADYVCIDIPGVYEVTVESDAQAATLVVGGRGLVTLRIDDPATPADSFDVIVHDSLHVMAGSTVVLEGEDTSLEVRGQLVNDGTIRTIEEFTAANWGNVLKLTGPASPTFRNRGLLHFVGNAYIIVEGGAFINEGDIQGDISGSNVSLRPGTDPTSDLRFELRSGTISSYFPLMVSFGGIPEQYAGNLVFRWTGGTSGRSRGDAGRSALAVSGLDVVFGNAALSGRIDLIGDIDGGTTRIIGDVPAGVYARLELWGGTHTFLFDTASAATNHGTIHVDPLSIQGTTTFAFGTLVNAGTIAVTDVEQVLLDGDSLVNVGALATAADVRAPRRGMVLRNEGRVVVTGPPLRMGELTTFEAVAGSVMSGRLVLESATLEGEGEVGTVIARDGTIRPGAPIGTLTAKHVSLDGRSALLIDLAGTDPGTHDQLAVSGEVVYGGATLSVAQVAPFTGGRCGQVVTIITDSATVARGTFGKLVGLAPGALSQWRIHNPANVLQLAGYNPVVAIGVEPDSVTVSEAGLRSGYAVCLGGAAPSSDVVVGATARNHQVEVSPETRTFTPSNWMLPQFFTLAAISDTLAEGPHAETVDHTIQSADPYYASAFLRWVDIGIIDDDVAVGSSSWIIGAGARK